MLQTLMTVIQVISFIFLGLSILILVNMVQRTYRSIYGHVNQLQGAPSVGLFRLPRDVFFILLFGVLGAGGLFFSNSMRGYSIFTQKTQIGTLKYKGQSKDGRQMILEYQKKDEDGNPIGAPQEFVSDGDSMLVWYTLVAVKGNFMLMGVKQIYKIDYVSGDWSNPQIRHSTDHIVIEGGRQEKYRKLRKNPSFPYKLWIDSVQFNRVEFELDDFIKDNKQVICKIYLVHNAIHLIEGIEGIDSEEIKSKEIEEKSTGIDD